MFSLRATLSFSRCVFAGRKRIIIEKCAALLWQNEFIKKVRGAILAEVNLL